ncbi:MAG: hypothetical protein FWF85_01820 [Clostridiales bacterium]|nr:hypothetical protein [Clostridiales bacterium]MDR2712144.1 hypothetical protein [Clostridiales bacterium]
MGAKTLFCDDKRISLQQGRLRLEIEIESGAAHKLLAPQKGKMQREIRERITCGARFYLWKDGKALFSQSSKKASFEYVQ